MRRGSFCLTIISLVFMWGLFSSFDYAKEWKAVNEQKDTNPKTALSKVNSIEKHAKAEGNAPQQIRCIIERGNAKNYIEEGAFTKCLEAMKQVQQQAKDDVARSVATYMIGKLYLKYYQDDAFAINRRTNLGNYVPEEFGFGYIKALAQNFYGIEDVELIKAIGLDINGAESEAILNEIISNLK